MKMPDLTCSARGAISEHLAIADLLQRGWEVYRAVNGGARCDLVAVRDTERLLVEVTTGRVYPTTGRLNRSPKDYSRFDVLAIVVGTEVIYEPEGLV